MSPPAGVDVDSRLDGCNWTNTKTTATTTMVRGTSASGRLSQPNRRHHGSRPNPAGSSSWGPDGGSASSPRWRVGSRTSSTVIPAPMLPWICRQVRSAGEPRRQWVSFGQGEGHHCGCVKGGVGNDPRTEATGPLRQHTEHEAEEDESGKLQELEMGQPEDHRGRHDGHTRAEAPVQ